MRVSFLFVASIIGAALAAPLPVDGDAAPIARANAGPPPPWKREAEAAPNPSSPSDWRRDAAAGNPSDWRRNAEAANPSSDWRRNAEAQPHAAVADWRRAPIIPEDQV
ncbi:hypothetical protein P691DRAFT_788375 [Macrolepiota fuliginosa MF-IS2]|uniref:Uncharacterized protein n=1 Tax=Macrolepiota fuliginosa MF-IS2 TaxID=1400762 RepID=A0A9P5XH39_9AGAR|nr:hypothetical protein P691DRAFT_788375 [Macrolepiota fuliginosa MF-IS2]